MHILNIASAIKKMPANELKDSIFENNHKRIGFVQERSYYSRKRWKIFFLLLDNLNL